MPRVVNVKEVGTFSVFVLYKFFIFHFFDPIKIFNYDGIVIDPYSSEMFDECHSNKICSFGYDFIFPFISFKCVTKVRNLAKPLFDTLTIQLPHIPTFKNVGSVRFEHIMKVIILLSFFFPINPHYFWNGCFGFI